MRGFWDFKILCLIFEYKFSILIVNTWKELLIQADHSGEIGLGKFWNYQGRYVGGEDRPNTLGKYDVMFEVESKDGKMFATSNGVG